MYNNIISNKMRQIFFVFLLLCCSFFSLKAQNLAKLVAEEVNESVPRPLTECDSPTLGGLLFLTAIEGLKFELNLTDNLKNVIFHADRNEYVLCVEPTNQRFIVIITGQGFETLEFRITGIQASRARYFRLTSDAPGEENNNVGERFLSEGKLTEAEERFRKAVEEAPENPRFHHNLANTLMLQEKYNDAVRSFQTAVDLAPNNTQYRNDLQRADDTRRSAGRELVPARSPTGVNRFGFADKNTGEVVIPFNYDRVWDFSEQIEGLAKVYQNTATQSSTRAILKYGFIDKTGKEVIPLKYDDIYTFSDQIEELALVRLGSNYGFIDKFGNEVIPVKYSNREFRFSEGLAVVMVGNSYGFIDRTGRELIPPKFTYAENFSGGLARARQGKNNGFIDVAGNFHNVSARDRADRDVDRRRARGEYNAILAQIEQANEAEKQRLAMAQIREREAQLARERAESENQ